MTTTTPQNRPTGPQNLKSLLIRSSGRVTTTVLSVALLSGCTTPPPVVTPQLAAFGGGNAKITDLQTGRNIFVGPCAKCHSLDSPLAFSTSEWGRIVSDMAEPAKINSAQQTLLLNYLLAARASLKAGKATQ
ncbi:MAG: hypothetical protein WCO60_02915 [Verrucomicrobiota bacterium]